MLYDLQIIGMRLSFISADKLTELKTERFRLIYYLIAEFLTAILCSSYFLLENKKDSMILILSLTYTAQQHFSKVPRLFLLHIVP